MPFDAKAVNQIANKHGCKSVSKDDKLLRYKKQNIQIQVYYTSKKNTITICVNKQQRYQYHVTLQKLNEIFQNPSNEFKFTYKNYSEYKKKPIINNSKVSKPSRKRTRNQLDVEQIPNDALPVIMPPSKKRKLNHNNNNNMYNNNYSIGTAGKRNQAQKALVKQLFHDVYNNLPDNIVICSTDGSSFGNPGPSGSGLVIRFGKNAIYQYVLSVALGDKMTNQKGELYAFGACSVLINDKLTDELVEYKKQHNIIRLEIHMFSDSEYSIKLLKKIYKARANIETFQWVSNELAIMETKYNAIIKYHHVGGHNDIELNEWADKMAVAGSNGSKYGLSVDYKQRLDLQSNAVKWSKIKVNSSMNGMHAYLIR